MVVSRCMAYRQRFNPNSLTICSRPFGLARQTQVAKAWALGQYHTTDQLPSILAEPLLSETLDKLSTLRGHGAHMRFKLQRLQVRACESTRWASGSLVPPLSAPHDGRNKEQRYMPCLQAWFRRTHNDVTNLHM